MTPTSTSPTGTSQPAPLLLGGDPQAVPVLRGDCEEGTAGAEVAPDASAPVQDPRPGVCWARPCPRCGGFYTVLDLHIPKCHVPKSWRPR